MTDKNIYKLISTDEVTEAKANVRVYEHIKTGAKIMNIACDDDNKVFCVAFRTPSENSCGTAHIIEHSVLCGSDKYPLKDPFVHLLKGSLNTFLNAMTFPDKTMYPIASQNESDFKNLMRVYLDAVFNPLIKHNKNSFYQEGWHYHITQKDEPLTINGIVYNEMKGAFSDPEEVISRYSQSSLYPNTSYSYESGGDPDCIPNLSYEEFIGYYKKYYHPSNSYIFLYGDMNADEYLAEIDRDYLSHYERQLTDSELKAEKPFDAPVSSEIKYRCDGDCDEKYYYSINYKIGDASDVFLTHAFNVLVKILFDTDASPLKYALTQAGLAEETDCEYRTGLKEPMFTIVAKNAPRESGKLFKQTVDDALLKLIDEGIDKDIITACINNYEFELREADSGNYPKGLIYIVDDIMESWLYDCDPLAFLRYEEQITKLRENENSEFYCGLIKKYLIENKHSSFVSLIPDSGLAETKEKLLKEKLAAFKSTLSSKKIEDMIAETKTLERLQAQPDSVEAVNTIPSLDLSEIEELPKKYELNVKEINNGRVLSYTDNCAGIVYADVCIDTSPFEKKELPVLELITKVLGVYATEHFNELALSNEIGKYLGDIDVSVSTYQDYCDVDLFEKRMIISVKALSENSEKMFLLIEDILKNTLINDSARLKTTIAEEISKFEASILSSCESFVNGRISAKSSNRGAYIENLKGLTYYNYLIELKAMLNRDSASCLSEINSVYKKLINAYNTDVLVTCDIENEKSTVEYADRFITSLPSVENIPAPVILYEKRTNEAVVTPSGICYAGLGLNFKTLGYSYPSQLAVARKYLRTGYLWENIRVKGGAYGAIMGADQGGDIYFISYRDPGLKRTYDVYDGIASDIANISFTKREMEKLIIGTVSDIDFPLPVYNRGRRALYDMYRHNTYEMQCEVRRGILSTVVSDINAMADFMKAINEKGVKVGAGFADAVNDCGGMFDNIYSIKRTQK